jgi:PBSX family phage terminase large subunit
MKDEHRYAVLYGGAGSGKSQVAAQKIVYRCISEAGTKEALFRHRIAVIRKYKTTLKQSVFEQIKAIIISLGIDHLVTINESYMNFKFWNGNEIFCSGLDDPEKIKSIVATSAWIEEASEIEEADFSQIDLRFRGMSEFYKQIILTFNPINESHWLKRKFFDEPQRGLTFVLRTTYRDNHFVGEEYKKLLEEKYSYDENYYRIYVKGEWGRIKTGSEYYFNFNYDKHVNDKIYYVPRIPLHISFDFNVNPYISATISQIQRREIDSGKSYFFVNVIDEFALPNPYNTTERLCEEIIEKYRDKLDSGVFIYGDASGRMRDTRNNISDYDVIEYAFDKWLTNYSIQVPKANPMIKKRRNFVNKLLFGGFNIDFRVSKNCRKLIEDFQMAIEEQDGSKKKQMAKDSVSMVVYEKYGHHADCNDYFLCAAFEKYFEEM